MLRDRCRLALVILLGAGCGGSSTAPTPAGTPSPSTGGPSAAAIETAVRDAYQREFGLTIPRPAIFNDVRSQNCLGAGHLATTAYLRTGSRNALLHLLYMPRDASAVTRKDPPAMFMAPSGTFRALVVVVQHSQTVGPGSLTLLASAQGQVNDDHAAFARARGFGSPIVRFESTNVAIDPSRIANPRDRASVLNAAASEGIGTAGYDFVISLNIDPSRSEGGFAQPGNGFIYVGNYSNWTGTLSGSDWSRIASTAYHHEAAHHWGWSHDWSPTCGGTTLGFEPLIAAPALFGWEDVDGDGVPEILDQTPYGRTN